MALKAPLLIEGRSLRRINRRRSRRDCHIRPGNARTPSGRIESEGAFAVGVNLLGPACPDGEEAKNNKKCGPCRRTRQSRCLRHAPALGTKRADCLRARRDLSQRKGWFRSKHSCSQVLQPPKLRSVARKRKRPAILGNGEPFGASSDRRFESAPPAARGESYLFTRERNSPVSVEILIMSPTSMWGGALSS